MLTGIWKASPRIKPSAASVSGMRGNQVRGGTLPPACLTNDLHREKAA